MSFSFFRIDQAFVLIDDINLTDYLHEANYILDEDRIYDERMVLTRRIPYKVFSFSIIYNEQIFKILNDFKIGDKVNLTVMKRKRDRMKIFVREQSFYIESAECEDDMITFDVSSYDRNLIYSQLRRSHY
jgi:hypothetical protein